jgi:hypothetical protein
MATEAKFPHITVRLDDRDGDAYAVLGRVMKALRIGGVSIADVDQYLFEATNGDYAHLLRTTMQWVSVIDGSGNRVGHGVTLPPPRRRLLTSRKIIPALLLAMTLGGCVTDNNAEPVVMLSDEQAFTRARKAILAAAKEPASVKFGERMYQKVANNFLVKWKPTPIVCGTVNGRNSFAATPALNYSPSC